MASCIRNIRTKNYQNLIIGFQVTVDNVGDAFWWHSVYVSPVPTQFLLCGRLFSFWNEN